MAIPRLSREEREAFLALPHIAVLSVANHEGRAPLCMPVWYGYQPGGRSPSFPARRAAGHARPA